MSQPKISLVVPVFNESDYIQDCLAAVLASQRQVDEIIIVDNNCTDNTIDLAHRSLSGYVGEVKIIKCAQQGVRFARVAGIDVASGDYIFNIDADTIISSDFFAEMVAFIDKRDLAAASALVRFSSRAMQSHLSPFKGVFALNIVIFGWQKLIGLGWVTFGSGSVVRTSATHQILPNLKTLIDEHSLHEDIAMGLLLRQQGYRIGLLPRRPLVGIDDRRIASGWRALWHRLGVWPDTYAALGYRGIRYFMTWTMVRVLVVFGGAFAAMSSFVSALRAD